MSDNRESLISIRSVNFKDEDIKFQLSFRMDFGRNECAERMNKIKSLGIDPSNNAVAVTHEFVSEEAAQAMATKINEFKAAMGVQLGKMMELCESVRAEGKKVVVCLRLPPEGAAALSILEAVAESMGDFASKNQFLDFKFSNSATMKEIMSVTNASLVANVLQSLHMKLALSLNKELPVKIAEFVSSMAPESEKSKVMFAGRMASAFHHFNIEVELKDAKESAKQAYKNEIMMGMMGVSQMLFGMGEQFGFIEAAKNGGSQTTVMLCLSPILSFEFGLYAPTALEALENAANPMQDGSLTCLSPLWSLGKVYVFI
eukprot:TRINITY_DN3103_c0_g1_i1.p9 TRINITY_DN3103_c0_g1~~TRINITY_DN3103_c0_g1_i1.p9  ORF type:complete len:316 (+),score=58.93 TRINITY_DN3103_c0_g1_i1:10033-10980(+)